MKIDTIELETKATLSPETLSILSSTDHNTYHKGTGEYLCYKYILEGYPCKVTIQYTVQNKKLRVNIPSLTKLVTGSSVIPLSDSDRDHVYSVIAHCLASIGIEAEPISEWSVRRMDTYHDFQVGDWVTEYISALSKVHIAKYKTIAVMGESIQFKCGSKEHLVYDKHKKLLNERGVTQEDIERSRGILRYEVRHKATDLSRVKGIESRKFGDLCTDEMTGSLIAKYFNKLPIANLRISTANEVHKKLEDLYGAGPAIRLMGFINAYGRKDLDNISRRTLIRYLNELRVAGVSPILGTMDLPPLTLPFANIETVATVIGSRQEGDSEYRRLPRTRKYNDQREIT